MSYKAYPDVGRLWMPNPTVSLPGRAVKTRPINTVVTTIRRPLWSIRGAIKLPDVTNPRPSAIAVLRKHLEPFLRLVDPRLFMSEVVWASISHNERVQDGGDHNVNLIFGTVGASNGVGANIAIADASLTPANTHASLNSDTQSVTTAEYTTIGLSRALGTVQNYSAPGSMDATYSVDIYKSMSVTGSGTAYGSALFDQAVVAGSWMLCEDNYTSNAVVENGDTLNTTWTYNN